MGAQVDNAVHALEDIGSGSGIDRKRSGFIDTSNIGEEYIRAYACTCASHS